MGRSSKVYVRLRKLSLSRKRPQREEGAHVDTSCLANHYCKNPTLPTQILSMPEPQIRHHWLLAMSQKVLFWFKWCSVHCHDCVPVSLLQLTLPCKSRWDPHSDHPLCSSLKEIFAKGYIGDKEFDYSQSPSLCCWLTVVVRFLCQKLRWVALHIYLFSEFLCLELANSSRSAH